MMKRKDEIQSSSFRVHPSSFLGQYSGKYVFDDITVNIGQSKISAGMPESEPRVVEAHEVEDRGVKIMKVNEIIGDIDAVIVA